MFIIYAEGVIFLEPKEILNEISEGSVSMNRVQSSLFQAVFFHPDV